MRFAPTVHYIYGFMTLTIFSLLLGLKTVLLRMSGVGAQGDPCTAIVF
jgi:hypothetical protein